MTHNHIIITGANSGLGKALALSYAKEGVALLLIARDATRLNAVAKLCCDKGAVVVVIAMSVTNKMALENAINEFDAKYPVDLVFANAGISNFGQHWNVSRAQQIFDVNVQGLVNTIHAVIPKLQQRQQGQIVLISSMASFVSLPRAPAYCASKSFVRTYGEALYESLKKHHVRVTVVCPGFIDTPLTEKNPYNMPFIMPVDKAVAIIRRGLAKHKPRIIFPLRMYWLTIILKWLPFKLAQKIAGKF